MVKHTIIGSVVLTLVLSNIFALIYGKQNSYKILTVYPKNPNENHIIFELGERHNIEFLPGLSSKLIPVSALFDDVKQRDLIQALNQKKIEYKFENIDSIMAKILKPMKRRMEAKARTGQTFDYDNTFHTLEEIYKELDRLSKVHSNNVSVFSIGKTYENRDIKAIKLFGNKIKDRTVVIDCGIHAREWISHTICMWFINQLVQNHPLLNYYDFLIVPVLNPDGYAFTWSFSADGKMIGNDSQISQMLLWDTRFWRKNRQLNPFPEAWTEPEFGQEFYEKQKRDGTLDQCLGIDLNRNFQTERFCAIGATPNPCSSTYCGKQSMRGSEVKAFAEYLTKQNDKIMAYFTFHNYGQLWMYPPSYSDQSVPNENQLDSLSSIAVKAIERVHGSKYEYGTISKVIYKTSGDSVSWIYHKLNVKIVFAVEARPLKDDPNHPQGSGFLIEEDSIKPNAEELFAGVEAVLNDMSQNSEEESNVTESSGFSTRLIPSLILIVLDIDLIPLIGLFQTYF